jgi:hypothetical protein
VTKQGASANTRSGGHASEMRPRYIVADPNGNREQRRAAKKLAKAERRAAPKPSDGEPS